MNMLWHYTTAANASLILACGELLPSTAGVPAREQPAVWFSRNQVCEPTALKAVYTSGGMRALTMQEQAEIGGLVRFGIPDTDARLVRWLGVGKELRMSMKMKTALERSGRQQGANPLDWFAITGPVAAAQLAVERWSPADGWR